MFILHVLLGGFLFACSWRYLGLRKCVRSLIIYCFPATRSYFERIDRFTTMDYSTAIRDKLTRKLQLNPNRSPALTPCPLLNVEASMEMLVDSVGTRARGRLNEPSSYISQYCSRPVKRIFICGFHRPSLSDDEVAQLFYERIDAQILLDPYRSSFGIAMGPGAFGLELLLLLAHDEFRSVSDETSREPSHAGEPDA